MQNWVFGLILKLQVSSFQNCLNFVSMTFTLKVIIKWCWAVLYCYILVFLLFQAISQNVFCDIRRVFPDRITYGQGQQLVVYYECWQGVKNSANLKDDTLRTWSDMKNVRMLWKGLTTFREFWYVVLNTLLASAKHVHAFLKDGHGQWSRGDILCYNRGDGCRI